MRFVRRVSALTVALAVALAAGGLRAADVDGVAARRFAAEWRGRGVRTVRTERAADGSARFHVVAFENGGWAVVGADDLETPVIAFADDGAEIEADARNAVWALVVREAERRAKGKGRGGKRHKGWSRQGSASPRTAKSASVDVRTAVPAGGLEDVRVAPLLGSTWDQATVGGYGNTAKCYNYHTPRNYVCGCVATMMAQILRYHEWPKSSVKPATFACKVGSDIRYDSLMATTNCTMIGGVYDWSKMPLQPSPATISEAECQEIGKLCYDLGVAAHMMWSGTGSGAFSLNARDGLLAAFGYRSAMAVAFAAGSHAYSDHEFRTIVISNCEAGLPVGYGISTSGATAVGHAVVIDGYGYSGDDFYVHVNPGWSGRSSAWYCPPDLSMGGYAFDSSDELVFNIMPENAGAIVCGTVTDRRGRPLAGAEIASFTVTKQTVRQGSKFRVNYVTNTLASVRTDARGAYRIMTGAESACALHLRATARACSASLSTNLVASVSMRGSSTSPFSGNYTASGYSLGNLVGVDLTLFEPFTIIVR